MEGEKERREKRERERDWDSIMKLSKWTKSFLQWCYKLFK